MPIPRCLPLLRPLLILALLLGPFSLASAWADAKLEGVHPAQWRLIWKESPATSATLSWSTAKAGKLHRVHVRSADGEEERVVLCHRSGVFQGSEGKLHYHHAQLKDLKPDTTYFVTLESDGERSPEMRFLTAHDDDRPFKLFYGGDSRSGREARRQMNKMLAKMFDRQPEILGLVHGGDYIASGRSLREWSEWMTDHELTTAADGRLLPMIPARGNHDMGELFNEVFDFPTNDNKNYYALSIGDQLRVITLNSQTSMGGDQARWLESELTEARPKHRWVVAQYHTPAYPAVKGPGGAKQHFVPLFEAHDVDLVCEADGHSIKRTVPIRNDREDPTGVVYIGEGGMGVSQRSPDARRWYLQAPGKVGKGHHIQLLSFDKKGLEYQAILLGGEVFDRHTLRPRN